MSSGNGKEAIGFSNIRTARQLTAPGLMAQVAVRTMRVVARALVIPIADDARGENQQHEERQRNPE